MTRLLSQIVRSMTAEVHRKVGPEDPCANARATTTEELGVAAEVDIRVAMHVQDPTKRSARPSPFTPISYKMCNPVIIEGSSVPIFFEPAVNFKCPILQRVKKTLIYLAVLSPVEEWPQTRNFQAIIIGHREAHQKGTLDFIIHYSSNFERTTKRKA